MAFSASFAVLRRSASIAKVRSAFLRHKDEISFWLKESLWHCGQSVAVLRHI